MMGDAGEAGGLHARGRPVLWLLSRVHIFAHIYNSQHNTFPPRPKINDLISILPIVILIDLCPCNLFHGLGMVWIDLYMSISRLGPRLAIAYSITYNVIQLIIGITNSL